MTNAYFPRVTMFVILNISIKYIWDVDFFANSSFMILEVEVMRKTKKMKFHFF